MDLSAPHKAVSPTLDGDVLVALARTARPLTGRDVVRVIGRASQTGVNRALRRLVEQGIVDAVEAGPAILYTLNRDHVAGPAVEALARLRGALIERLRELIAAWPVPPRHASLFGSAARGDGSAGSDIDIFIARPARVAEDDPHWRDQVEDLSRRVARWTGNPVTISELSSSDARRLRENRPAITDELLRDAVTLGGKSIESIVS